MGLHLGHGDVKSSIDANSSAEEQSSAQLPSLQSCVKTGQPIGQSSPSAMHTTGHTVTAGQLNDSSTQV